MIAPLVAVVAVAWSVAGAPVAARPIDWAIAVFPSGAEFNLEIAADPAARRLGYMFRDHVGPDEGMLFLFEEPGRHSIWMKDCKVALDIIWLDESWSVIAIAHERPPCPDEGECPGVAPMRSASYVLEIAGGSANAHGLRVGDRLQIRSEPPFTP